jgi:hypothetical protein
LVSDKLVQKGDKNLKYVSQKNPLFKPKTRNTVVGPKVTTWRGMIWLRDSLWQGGRGREPREPRERKEREGQGLKYPSVRPGMI